MVRDQSNKDLEPPESGAQTRAALELLASRARSGGLFLAAARTDGSIYYHDAAASEFFLRYLVPVLSTVKVPQLPESETSKENPAATPGVCWVPASGLIAAAVPTLERKARAGLLVVIAKHGDFSLTDEVRSCASNSGIADAGLSALADKLPTYGPDALLHQAQLLRGAMSDQVTIGRQKKELDSLTSQLSNTYEELTLLYQLSSGMKVNRSPADFFKQACCDVMGVMDVRGLGVVLRGEGALNQPPTIYGNVSPDPAALDRLTQVLMGSFEQGKSVLLNNNLAKDATLSFFATTATQLLAVPLTRGAQLLGCLFALDKNVDEFNSVDSKLLTSIGNESAVYLENASLFEDVHELVMGLLHSLTSAVDAKDAYTCGHSERVALLGRHLALATGMSETQADRIYMAGLLHDVGKIGVPETVLQKTGKLTAEEFEQIKRHPDVGARILKNIKQIEDVIPGVLHHHERYDGKGYPCGLAGEAIPLMGRIICLADCFDAMTSSRTYRQALPVEVALTEICRCAGTQFDPRLADVFVKLSPDELRDLLKNHSASLRRVLDQPQALRAA